MEHFGHENGTLFNFYHVLSMKSVKPYTVASATSRILKWQAWIEKTGISYTSLCILLGLLPSASDPFLFIVILTLKKLIQMVLYLVRHHNFKFHFRYNY